MEPLRCFRLPDDALPFCILYVHVLMFYFIKFEANFENTFDNFVNSAAAT